MNASVILTTYNQPSWLEKALRGYAMQSARDFQLLIADDGSGPDTARVIERLRTETELNLVHVWHADRGFRKCEILNRAIVAADGEYLIFSDGDCIPRHDFVATHLRLSAAGRFLSGGYLKLPSDVSERIGIDDIRSGRIADLAWLRTQGWRPGRRILRLLQPGVLPQVLDLITPTRATWNGHNASTWKEALLEVNGFDAEMKYGGQDRALGERLEHLGLRGKQIRHRAPVLHLYHERPYRTEEAIQRNREIRERIARNKEVRARCGIAELEAESDE